MNKTFIYPAKKKKNKTFICIFVSVTRYGRVPCPIARLLEMLLVSPFSNSLHRPLNFRWVGFLSL